MPTIEYVKQIEGTPVLPYVIDAYVALRKAGNIDAEAAPATGDEEAFFIRSRGRIVAVLSFHQPDDVNSFVVNMGFVSTRHRKRGLYAQLWDRLVREASERGIRSILGYHKASNAAILAFSEKHGRRIKYVCTEYVVEGA